MNWIARHKYQTLLVTLLALVFVYPVLGHSAEYRIIFDLLLTLVFLSSLLVLFADRRFRIAAFVFGGPVLVGSWIGYFMPGVPRKPVAVSFHLISAVFLGFLVWTLMRKVYRERSVSADAVYGAFCGYLILGLAFGHIYSAIAWVSPDSFRGDETIVDRLEEEWHRHFLLIYFSFMTLTTVGYGDMTPKGDFARGITVMEAVAGQFYIAVLVAELIGRRVGQRSWHDPTGPGNAGHHGNPGA